MSSPVLLLLLSLLFTPLATSAQATYTDSGGLCTSARRAVSLALPAVVRIVTTYQAQLTYFNTDGSSIVFPQNGGSYTLAVTGSGAFISGNGDILTAYDAVNTSQDALNVMLAQLAAPDIARALNDASLSQPVTTTEVLTQLLNDPFIWQSSFQAPQSSFYFSSQYAGPTTAASVSALQSFPIVITAESASKQSTDSDLAILHADGFHDLPTISLGDSSQVYQDDTLTIIGYPDSADLVAADGSVDPNNFITASVNTVTVSAIKTTESGAQLIQIGGDSEQGENGSPALNTDGQLVGTISYTAQTANGSGQTNFLSTVNDAKILARQARVNTAQDTFDQRWAAAYDTCSSTAPGHWHDAYNQYTQIAHLYPNFKGVEPYLTYTKTQAAHESTASQNHALPGWAIALIAAVALLALGVGVVLVRRRTLAARAGASYAGYGPGLSKGASYDTTTLSSGTQPTTPELIPAQLTALAQPAEPPSASGTSQPTPGSASAEQV
jgi:S1-C subfamily serine protease